MLSGDKAETADEVGRALGLDEVYGGLLPAQKVEKLEEIMAAGASPEAGSFRKAKTPNAGSKGACVAYVGDGINDAPVLARADVGIAMGGLGSDAAIEAADVVIMTDEPGKVAEAVDVARATRRVAGENIGFALGVKAVVMLLGLFGLANMWEAVFADVGVALLAVLNATRLVWWRSSAAVNQGRNISCNVGA
jgi:Cd2+/Zn2+-exporting ATPase